MKVIIYTLLFICITLLCSLIDVNAQSTIRGKLIDSKNGEPLIGATIIVAGSSIGTVSDFDGAFILKIEKTLPLDLEIRYTGYASKKITYTDNNKSINIKMDEEAIEMAVIEIVGSRISDKQKESPLTIESMDQIAIKQTPAVSFYDGLGTLKDVDLTAASLGFKIINTRGFNSTSPVRSLQIIDGVDNQAPGLNFSLGNFLGASDLDVNKVDLVVGAASAFYGPNAFNGVIAMETKSPFFQKGLTASIKAGERSLIETSIRYADAFKTKVGNDVVAYKLNFFYLGANDWEAQNYGPVQGQRLDTIFENHSLQNPGGYDKINVYGDEYYSLNDVTGSKGSYWQDPGLRRFYRTGYREIDLVDYKSRNYKASGALHFRLHPEKKYESPEIIISSSFGSGTTVYQGDNRFRLKNILFFQNRLELKKESKYFIRLYATHEDAGDSYDPYFTAISLQQQNKSDEIWATDYRRFWKQFIVPKIQKDETYPKIEFDPNFNPLPYNYDKANQWMIDNQDSLAIWHSWARNFADTFTENFREKVYRFAEPGSPEFQRLFNKLISSKSNAREGGTKFYDKSALYHAQAEYKFNPSWTDQVTIGGSSRLYTPKSDGTIFYDSAGIKITNFEYGIYGGFTKKFLQNKLVTNGAIRLDKNQNFNFISTPAVSAVYSPKKDMYIRTSFSSAIRNPTLTDQYLHLNVGRAILSGNINGVDSLITVESFIEYLGDKTKKVNYFNIAGVQPEKVKTFELGFRSTLFKSMYVDMGYYYSVYNNFLGYNIGIKAYFDPNDPIGLPRDVQAYRYAANSTNTVTTQGISIGINQYFLKRFTANGNYSYNKLLKADENDPIIPAFNTPLHKYNLGLSGRDLEFMKIKNIGFSINYKWVQGFQFEGSPQFTGFIPSYGLLDAQVNYLIPKINTTMKVGGSNVLKNEHYETYGGPIIGRLIYASLVYEFKKN